MQFTEWEISRLQELAASAMSYESWKLLKGHGNSDALDKHRALLDKLGIDATAHLERVVTAQTAEKE